MNKNQRFANNAPTQNYIDIMQNKKGIAYIDDYLSKGVKDVKCFRSYADWIAMTKSFYRYSQQPPVRLNPTRCIVQANTSTRFNTPSLTCSPSVTIDGRDKAPSNERFITFPGSLPLAKWCRPCSYNNNNSQVQTNKASEKKYYSSSPRFDDDDSFTDLSYSYSRSIQSVDKSTRSSNMNSSISSWSKESSKTSSTNTKTKTPMSDEEVKMPLHVKHDVYHHYPHKKESIVRKEEQEKGQTCQKYKPLFLQDP